MTTTPTAWRRSEHCRLLFPTVKLSSVFIATTRRGKSITPSCSANVVLSPLSTCSAPPQPSVNQGFQPVALAGALAVVVSDQPVARAEYCCVHAPCHCCLQGQSCRCAHYEPQLLI